MGFLARLLGKKLQLQVTVSIHTDPSVVEHAEELKEATRLKRRGDIEAAIDQCRKAIAQAEAGYGPAPSGAKFTNTLRDYFKLARYLAEANRVEEAWAVLLHRLNLAKDPRNSFDRSLVPVNCSLVYSEMRKLAAKTGDYVAALKYAAAEMVAWDQSMMLQGRTRDLPELPIKADDLPRYIKTYCSRLKATFTVEDFASFITSAYEGAKGRYTSIDLEALQQRLIKLIESAGTGDDR